MIDSTAPRRPFAGWYRPTKRHRWVKLSEGNDYGDVLNRLLDRVDEMRPTAAEILVSRVDPNEPAMQRRLF